VARERNFTRAAQILHIAQPPLSRQVQQLEDELGVTLIERGSRPLRLTDAGRLLFEQAVQLLERVEEMKAITQRLNEAERPRFRIGFVPSTLYGRLPELIRRARSARVSSLPCSNSPPSSRSPRSKKGASMSVTGGSRSTIPQSSGCCFETRGSPRHCLPDTPS
jgi:hypothetical protein